MVGSEPHEEGAGLVLTVGEAAKSRVSDLAKGSKDLRIDFYLILGNRFKHPFASNINCRSLFWGVLRRNVAEDS